MSSNTARFRGLLVSCACGALGSVACGSGSSGYGDAPGASGAQLSWDFATSAAAPETLLALVDDTPQAADLRAVLADAFDDWDNQLAIHRASCDGPVDPAAWHPMDRSVVFVHPSEPVGTGYTSPAQDPALRLQTQQIFGPDRARWMDAVRAGLEAQPAAPGAPFQALAALADAESLLAGSRPPATTAESDVLASLPALPTPLSVVIALGTEDASPGEPSEYPSPLGSSLLGVLVPASDPRPLADCSGQRVPTTPRYQALGAFVQAWPCDNPDFFQPIWDDCSVRCLREPIAVDAGNAQCLAMARYSGNEPCPVELGWLDPLDGQGKRTPRVDGSGSSAKRVCEIRQLEGSARDACITRLDCADCEPGWCATEVPELIPQQVCASGFYPPFRFVLGAGQAKNAQVTVVCNEAAH